MPVDVAAAVDVVVTAGAFETVAADVTGADDDVDAAGTTTASVLTTAGCACACACGCCDAVDVDGLRADCDA